jgi:hypothetical protein
VARGLPDYYNPATLVATRLVDVNDLVSAQMGFTPVDNLGRIFWYDNFRQGLQGYDLIKAGDGDYPVASITRALVPPMSIKLHAGTDGGGGDSEMDKRFLFNATPGIGVEIAVWYITGCPIYYLGVQVDDGVTYSNAVMQVRPDLEQIEISTGGSLVGVLDLPTPPAGGHWLPVKMAFSKDDLTYLRIVAGQYRVDVSGYALPSSASLISGRLQIRIVADNIDATDRTGYLGYIVLTTDEP